MTLIRKAVTIVVVGALIGGASGASTAATNETELGAGERSPAGTGVSEAGAAIPVQPNATANVSVDNQTTTGDHVTIASVTVPDGGFVVVHDTRLLEGNVLGSIAGVSAYLEPGRHTNVSVPLDAPLNRSQRVVAIPYRDSNGNETFEFRSSQGSLDGPYRKDNRVVSDAAVVETTNGTATRAETTADRGVGRELGTQTAENAMKTTSTPSPGSSPSRRPGDD